MMQRPTSQPKRLPTFIENAYQAFDHLRDAMAAYHVVRHMEIIGDSAPILSGWEQVYNQHENKTHEKLYVEGTLVLIYTTDHDTGNKWIRTTNGDKWYGTDNTRHLHEDVEPGKARAKTPWAA